MLLPAPATPRRVTVPAAQPVSLAEAKAHLRLDDGDEDVLVQTFIEAATTLLDGWSGVLGRCLVEQGWSVELDDWPSDRCIRLPFPDVSAAAITYVDAAGAVQTLSDALHSTPFGTDLGAVIMIWDETALPALKPGRPRRITVTFTAGYGTPDEVPAAIRAAILIMVADLFQHRGSTQPGVVSVPRTSATVDALLAPYRRVGL